MPSGGQQQHNILDQIAFKRGIQVESRNQVVWQIGEQTKSFEH
jgi:hypothetical protein